MSLYDFLSIENERFLIVGQATQRTSSSYCPLGRGCIDIESS